MKLVPVSEQSQSLELYSYYFVDDSNAKQGTFTTFYHNGKPMVQCDYVDNQTNGDFKMWYAEGQLYEHSKRLNSQVHGLFTTWWPNGSIKLQCNFDNGVQVGESKSYDSYGNLISHLFYKNDEPIVDFLNGDPYPKNDEEMSTFKEKYGNLPLL